jgi:hypothetical protein
MAIVFPFAIMAASLWLESPNTWMLIFRMV